MNQSYIYKLTDTRNGFIYIGKHNGNNVDYFTGGKIPKRIIKKYGKGVLKREIIKKGKYTNEQLNDLEVFYIAVFRSYYEGYNLTKGGDGVCGFKMSEETRQKISNTLKNKPNSFKGKKHSEKSRKNMSEAHKGYKHTEEQKRKISESLKGRFGSMNGKRHSEETKRKMSEATSGKKHPFYGKTHTEESKRAMSISKKGFNHTEESKKKISNGLLGRECKEETRKKISEANKSRWAAKKKKLIC